ncbi:MAG: phospho-N-acetylmuramoyl-pentapeptide-transferase [Oscillospiraceae bacterium]|jgi:phospho-N-acetylmuramoyl-pentapeptide-transferase|nr:phospho-N-acetylmuramoyl-pentapeptide-transferase [Oscillospiraceae bacterium]
MGLLLMLSFIVSFAVSVIIALILIPILKRMKAGQSIREDGPVWHNKKQGTPTMGGIIFITGITITCLTVGFFEMREGRFGHISVLVFALVFAAIGMFDDYIKLKKKQNLGLRAKQKFALQLLVAIGFVVIMHLLGNLTTSLYIPFFDVTFLIPTPIYYAFAAFVIVGTVNSVNITDGTDGLTSGVTIPVAICILLLAFHWNHTTVAIFSIALIGGLAAFLIFNFYPAKVFMGDTGSLFLGGAVCAMAFAMDIPLLLIVLGFVYFIETLSVIIQVTYFKLTKGKRVFKMSPIHHHFEMIGWSEYKLFAIFTTVSAIFATIAYFGVVNMI